MSTIDKQKHNYVKVQECIDIVKKDIIVKKIISYVTHTIYESEYVNLSILVFLINGVYEIREFWTDNFTNEYKYQNTLKYRMIKSKTISDEIFRFIQASNDIEDSMLTWLFYSVESSYENDDDLSMSIVLL
jgi:hypothetical protein